MMTMKIMLINLIRTMSLRDLGRVFHFVFLTTKSLNRERQCRPLFTRQRNKPIVSCRRSKIATDNPASCKLHVFLLSLPQFLCSEGVKVLFLPRTPEPRSDEHTSEL